MTAVLQLKTRILGKWKQCISCVISVTEMISATFSQSSPTVQSHSPVHQIKTAYSGGTSRQLWYLSPTWHYCPVRGCN